MWSSVLGKLEILKSMDRQCQAFGAEGHRYLLKPRVPPGVIIAAEQKLGCQLPEQLSCFYTEVGNGVAGPYYGLYPLQKLGSNRPEQQYMGAEALSKLKQVDVIDGKKNNYNEWSNLPDGLIAICHEGCSHRLCIIATGERPGQIVHVSEAGEAFDTDLTLVGCYHHWLDKEITVFQAIKEMMLSGAQLQKICDNAAERFDCHNAEDIMVSIINQPKPENLFGSGNDRKYSSTQWPWYEKTYAEWRKKKLWWKFWV